MPSIETSIWMALKGRIETLALNPAMPVAWPNESVSSPPATGYIRVSHIPNISVRMFTNSPVVERLGILQIMVLTPRTKKVAQSIEVAGQIAAHFPQDLGMWFDGVRVDVEKTPDVAQALPGDVYWETPVMIRYRCLK